MLIDGTSRTQSELWGSALFASQRPALTLGSTEFQQSCAQWLSCSLFSWKKPCTRPEGRGEPDQQGIVPCFLPGGHCGQTLPWQSTSAASEKFLPLVFGGLSTPEQSGQWWCKGHRAAPHTSPVSCPYWSNQSPLKNTPHSFYISWIFSVILTGMQA